MTCIRRARRSRIKWTASAGIYITYSFYIYFKCTLYTLCTLHQMREALETKLGSIRRAFAEADSRCKLYMGENDRLQKELVTMREVLRCTCFTS
jgi:hypothetical protein